MGDVRKLAEAHWAYSRGLLTRCKITEMDDLELLSLMGFLYTEAMVHGYKHAIEDTAGSQKPYDCSDKENNFQNGNNRNWTVEEILRREA